MKNETKVEHTPTPLEAQWEIDFDGYTTGWATIFGPADDDPYADPGELQVIAERVPAKYVADIVHAVNAHHELVAALKDSVRWVEKTDSRLTKTPWFKRAEAALAKESRP